MLEPGPPIRIETSKPVLLVVVDTEEEFDWAGGFDRGNTSVRNIGNLDRIQEVFDAFGVRPTYLVDYPVATTPAAARVLRAYAAEGRAEIGAHLHPWVNPPHEEEVGPRNSYAGNLPPDLERRKLSVLSDAIASAFGARPAVYRAGRHGVGAATARILEELGYEVDLSVRPRISFRDDGGPDFLRFGPEPYWFGRARRLADAPGTAAWVGRRPLAARALRPLNRGLLSGAFSRLRALERLKLTPEGVAMPDLRRLTLELLGRGQRVFVFDFHSPSATPGCTPYVRNREDLSVFLDRCRRYCEFFLGEAGGVASTPLAWKRAAEAAAGA